MINKLICLFLLISMATFGQEMNIFDIARKGSLEQIKVSYQSNPEIINTIDTNQYSPLILACYRGNKDVAKFLINNVKNLDYNSGIGTVIMAATYKNELELLKLLLEKNANPNIADTNALTPLMMATQTNNIEVVKLLLQYKADKNLKNKEGKTAFEIAVFSGNELIINTLK